MTLLIGLLFISCKKEKLKNSDLSYEIQGHWLHNTSNTDFIQLTIDDLGGSIKENSVVIHEKKNWFLKDRTLTFGRFAYAERKFHIDSFPQTATQDFVVGFDSVKTGNTYWWLDGDLFHH